MYNITTPWVKKEPVGNRKLHVIGSPFNKTWRGKWPGPMVSDLINLRLGLLVVLLVGGDTYIDNLGRHNSGSAMLVWQHIAQYSLSMTTAIHLMISTLSHTISPACKHTVRYLGVSGVLGSCFARLFHFREILVFRDFV